MKTLLLILTILFVVIPLTGFILLIRWVIKKSKADQPPAVLEKEKNQLIAKVRSKKSSLTPWKPEFIEEISNTIDFNYSKSFTRRFNGVIQTLNGDKIIAFRRLDRGQFKVTSRIFVAGSNFEIFYDLKDNEMKIYFNSTYLGKMINHSTLLNTAEKPIGTVSRNQDNKDYYLITLHDDQLAYVVKNTDRRTFLRNPFYDFRPSNALEVDAFIDNEEATKLTKLAKLYHELDKDSDDYKWALALITFEAVYYGIDFLQ
ncbi:hypothetical protein [Lacinutrix chionoecetis]